MIVTRARELVEKRKVAGLMLTGGFVTLFNPGIEAKVADATGLPVVTAISSATAALTVFGAKSVLLMTPFDRTSNESFGDIHACTPCRADCESDGTGFPAVGFDILDGPSAASRRGGSRTLQDI